MPSIVSPTTTVIEKTVETVKTQNSEVTVNINLTLSLKLEQDGTLRVSSEQGIKRGESWSLPEDKIEKEIPDLDDGGSIIQFGKNV